MIKNNSMIDFFSFEKVIFLSTELFCYIKKRTRSIQSPLLKAINMKIFVFIGLMGFTHFHSAEQIEPGQEMAPIVLGVGDFFAASLSACDDMFVPFPPGKKTPFAEEFQSSTDGFLIHQATPIQKLLFAYNEEANIHFSRSEYVIALEKYQKVVQYIQDNRLSDPSNLLEAMCGSMFCYDLLGQDSFAKAAFDELVYEVALLNEEIEDVGWFKQSRIYPRFKQNPDRYAVSIEKIGLPDATPEDNCQFQCNGYAVAAAYACGRVPNAAIQFACFGCIFGLEQLCLRCCKGEGFWENLC